MEDTTHSLEESIKRVVCIENSIQGSTAVTELMSPSKEPDATLQVDNVAADIKLIDVVNGKSQEDETIPVNVVGNLEKPEELPPEETDQSNATEEEKIEEDLDSDSEDDLQVIVNDEDIFYPHGIEGVEDAEGEEMFVVPGDEHYEELDWAAEMHYVHSQYKYVRPGSGQDAGTQDQTPGAKAPGIPAMPFPPGGYGMEMYYPFYEFILPPSKTVFDIDIDQFEDKPWSYPGTDITDYFNYGLTEETWRQYCEEFAKVRDASSMKSKRRQDNGHLQQGWNYDNGGYSDYSEPQHRGRGPRGMRNHMEGGIHERRSTGDLRRQRLRDSVEISLQDRPDSEFRRRPRSDDLQRRKGYSRHEQDNPLTGRGRLHFSQASPSGAYPSDAFSPPKGGRQGMYNSRHRMPSPGDLRNGFRRDNSSYPWRRNEDQYDDEDNLKRPWRRNEQNDDDGDASYGSSGHSDYRESDKDESEDEYMSRYQHRLRRFSAPLEKRLGARTEMEKPSVRLSRHAVEEDEDTKARSEPLKRSPQRAERSSALAQVSSQRRASEMVTEKRSSQVVKRLGQVSESRTIQLTTEKRTEKRLITERKTQREVKQREVVERKQAEAIERRPALERRTQTVTEKQTEVVTETRQQSISERRAHLIAERKEKQRKMEKEKAKMEKAKSNIPERKEKARVDIPREKARVDIPERAKATIPERQEKARVDIPERTEKARVDIPERREKARADISGRKEKARVDIPEEQERGKVVNEKRSLKLFRDRLGGSQQIAEKSVREKKVNHEMRPDSKTGGSLQRSSHGSEKKPSSRTLKLDERSKSKQQESSGKDDLRMKVLEKVSARWKLHLRMDDAHAKRKREGLNKPVPKGNDEETRALGYEEMDIDEKDEDEYEIRRQEKREEKKRKHRERKERQRMEEEYKERDLDEYEQKGDERWQMEDADYNGTEYEEDSGIERERKRRHERYEEEESEEEYNRRPHTRYEYEYDEAYEMKEEGECEEDADGYENDLDLEEVHSQRRKRRRYNDDLYKEHYSEYDAEPAYEETRREYTYDDSVSSGQGEEVFYKRKGRGNMDARRDSDRWTGNLDDSAEDEYEEEYE